MQATWPSFRSDAEFWDCRSEASFDQDFFDGQSPSTGKRPPSYGQVKPPQGVSSMADDLLATLYDVERRCRGGNDAKSAAASSAPSGPVGEELRVNCVLDEGSTKFWMCEAPGNPVITAVLVTRIADVRAKDAAEAIRVPELRMAWDGDTFRRFEMLREADPEDPTSAEVLKAVLVAPRPLKDRELLQYRWLLDVPGGGIALLLRSFEDEAILPTTPDLVRAFTHLSGYVLRPLEGGELEVVCVSQMDLGGSVPNWAQNFIRRLAKRKPVQWTRMLEQYCRQKYKV